MGSDQLLVVTISGRGDKDCAAIARYMADMIADETLGANESLGITNGRA